MLQLCAEKLLCNVEKFQRAGDEVVILSSILAIVLVVLEVI